MKKIALFLCIYLSVICINAFADVDIVEDNFPDPVFRSYISTFDLNGNGQLDEKEIINIKEISIDKSIAGFYDPIELSDIDTVLTGASVSLKGIEFFTELNSIKCSYHLESLDISALPKLKSLNIDGSLLPSLDISHNPQLIELSCDSCQLTQLNVSNNPLLIKLVCSFNQLTSLDLSNNINLVKLSCNHNLFKTLDLRNNKELIELDCGDNQIKDLDLSNNTKLERLYVYRNPHINLPKSCINLQALFCFSCDLTSIDTSGFPQLTDLRCSYNHIGNLDISRNNNLQNLDCSHNDLIGLDISTNDKIDTLMCEYNTLQSLTLGNASALKYLCCSNNQLSSLDIANKDSLEYVQCFGNSINTLDLQQCINFEDLVLDWKKDTYQQYDVGTVKSWSGQKEYIEYHLIVDDDVEILTSLGVF